MTIASELPELARRLAPTASVYVGTATPGAADFLVDRLVRHRRLVGALYEQAADGATVDAIEDFLARLPHAGPPQAVFAADGHVVFAAAMRGGSVDDEAAYGAPIRLLPLLRWLHSTPAHVLVVPAAQEALIYTVPAGGWAERNAHSVTHVGRHRSPPQGARDSWARYAPAVAAAVVRQLDQSGARLVLVASSVRASTQVARLLAAYDRPVTVRWVPPPARPNHAGKVAAVLAAFAGRTTEQLCSDAFAEGTISEGADAALDALNRSAGGVLLLCETESCHARGWFGSHLLAAAGAGSAPFGTGLRQGRLADVAVRAALCSGAEVRFVPAGRLREGIAYVPGETVAAPAAEYYAGVR